MLLVWNGITSFAYIFFFYYNIQCVVSSRVRSSFHRRYEYTFKIYTQYNAIFFFTVFPSSLFVLFRFS